MKIVACVNVLPNYISLLIVSSLKSAIFISLPFVFSRSWTSLAEVLKRFLVHKSINTINSLSCWRVTLLNFFANCKWVILEIFWTVFAKSPSVFRRSWILNECNLSWKIVKYCILYEVCMIKTAPHSTLSPQTWCIKKYKRLVCTHPDLLARICKVNLSNRKNSAWFVFHA